MQLGLLTFGKTGNQGTGNSGISFTLCIQSGAPAKMVPAKIRVGLPSSVKVSGKTSQTSPGGCHPGDSQSRQVDNRD